MPARAPQAARPARGGVARGRTRAKTPSRSAHQIAIAAVFRLERPNVPPSRARRKKMLATASAGPYRIAVSDARGRDRAGAAGTEGLNIECGRLTEP